MSISRPEYVGRTVNNLFTQVLSKDQARGHREPPSRTLCVGLVTMSPPGTLTKGIFPGRGTILNLNLNVSELSPFVQKLEKLEPKECTIRVLHLGH